MKIKLKNLQGQKILSFFLLLFLLVILFFSLRLVKTAQRYLSEALGEPANIVVETKMVLGPMPKPWQALSQGGEEKGRMLASVIGEVAALQPRYIRIDHIYDFYDVVKRENGGLKFDWNKLDQTVDDILATGAKPLFSLSFMPPAIAQGGNVVSPPNDWHEWSLVVQKAIEHYSGRNQKNLADVYYEVWNEPDLFGKWHLGCSSWRVGCDPEKDYRLLYKFAALGAEKAEDVNPFKIGGPGTTGLYRGWVDGFLSYVADNRLRFDFYSWHRYSIDPEDFRREVDYLDYWLFKFSGYSLLPKLISEWGSISENSPWHDGRLDAAHLIASMREMLGRIDLAFIFEIKDGVSPAGDEFWGGWGLLTHEKFGKHKKLKYFGLEMLNQLEGKRINLSGEGTWVKGMAARENEKIKLLLVNYDPRDQHSENTPITFIDLEPGSYSFSYSSLLGKSSTTEEKVGQGGVLKKMITMFPNSVVFIELTKISP